MPGSVQVVRWTAEHDAAIDGFVAGHAEGLIYYTAAYRRYLLEVAGGECQSLVAVSAGKVVGVLPLMLKDGPFGPVLNSLPFFGSNGGVLAAGAEAEAALIAGYDREAAAATVATWISHPFMDTAAPRHDLTDERIAQWTMLPADGVLPPSVEASARRNIQKAQAAGVTVRESPEALPFLEATHRANLGAIGGRAKPAEFFSRLSTMTYGRDWRLHVAEQAGSPLAALLTFEAVKTIEYVMPVVVESARSLQPTSMILASAMADASRRGFRRWNWGGTWLTQEGVYRFKKKWGADERRYRYYIRLNDASLRRRSAAELSAGYAWYFTLPYDRLAPAERPANGH
jgi:hypothetical protein